MASRTTPGKWPKQVHVCPSCGLVDWLLHPREVFCAGIEAIGTTHARIAMQPVQVVPQGTSAPGELLRKARAYGLAQAIADCRDDAPLTAIREGAAEIVKLLSTPAPDPWMTNEAQIPEVIDAENARGFVSRAYRKRTTTQMVGPVTLTRPTKVETSEGGYDLSAGWEGYIAIDADGKPYPVERSIHERTYESAEPEAEKFLPDPEEERTGG